MVRPRAPLGKRIYSLWLFGVLISRCRGRNRYRNRPCSHGDSGDVGLIAGEVPRTKAATPLKCQPPCQFPSALAARSAFGVRGFSTAFAGGASAPPGCGYVAFSLPPRRTEVRLNRAALKCRTPRRCARVACSAGTGSTPSATRPSPSPNRNHARNRNRVLASSSKCLLHRCS